MDIWLLCALFALLVLWDVMLMRIYLFVFSITWGSLIWRYGTSVQSRTRTDHLETRALPEGPGSVGGPMRCPWYLFHRLF
ncbi:unnamed protein product [Staurois parvus]|uniref:Uncharacterized protein n=1 Tax=Staurois parvus TaxID=386267 RepID=A0ABN9HNS6_9NEOB|nr:unnamed protein product [Staurois parvus]